MQEIVTDARNRNWTISRLFWLTKNIYTTKYYHKHFILGIILNNLCILIKEVVIV